MQEEQEKPLDFSYMTKGISKYWRPAMAWQYFAVCIFDFIIMPSILAFLAYEQHISFPGWEPLTLRGGGLYHLSMGAIVGVTSWMRGKEKIAYIDRFGPQRNEYGGFGGYGNFGGDPYRHPFDSDDDFIKPELQPTPKPEPKEDF